VDSTPPLILGTRGSALALAQTRLTAAALEAAFPGTRVAVREIKTTGDKRQDLSLTHLAPGGHGYTPAEVAESDVPLGNAPAVGPARFDPGLFTRELETELLAGTISVAVHSLKDLPTVMPGRLQLAAVLPRAATPDVLIYKEVPGARMFPPEAGGSSFPALPADALIATSSLRRQYQLLRSRPGLRVCEVRGNVGTRLAKLHAHPEWTGLVLALAGLERLGYAIVDGGWLEAGDGMRFRTAILTPDIMLPAVGQGAIGLQARADDEPTLRALAAVNDPPTWAAVTAERELLRLLGGGCQLPLGVRTDTDPVTNALRMEAVLFGSDAKIAPRFAAAAGSMAEPTRVAAELFRCL
jgi:hydroxymethylbilane synthase